MGTFLRWLSPRWAFCGFSLIPGDLSLSAFLTCQIHLCSAPSLSLPSTVPRNQGLLASCSWDSFAIPGGFTSQDLLWCEASSFYQGTCISPTINIYATFVPSNIWESRSIGTGSTHWGAWHRSVWLAHAWVKLQFSVPIRCKGIPSSSNAAMKVHSLSWRDMRKYQNTLLSWISRRKLKV